MDANGVRHHLLLGRQDWFARYEDGDTPADDNITWDHERNVLTLRREIFVFPQPKGEQVTTAETRRGADRDRYGNSYWIGADERTLYFQPVHQGEAQHFWSVDDWLALPDPPEPATGDFTPDLPSQTIPALFRGLAVTREHYLVVGTLEPAGLLIFDLHAGGPPLELRWESSTPFNPVDMIAAYDGGVWVLDVTGSGASRLWRLDRQFNVITQVPPGVALPPPEEEDFTPELPPDAPEPDRVDYVPGSLVDDLAVELAGPEAPTALIELPDHSVLILDTPPDSDFSLLYRYRDALPVGEAYPLEPDEEADVVLPQSLIGFDMAFVPDADQDFNVATGRLYIPALEGNQAFGFAVSAYPASLQLAVLPEYLSMRLYSGIAVVADDEAAYYLSSPPRWLKLVPQPRPRYATDGTLETPVFDGKTYDCVWHRLLIDACIPPETRVIVESRAANDEDRLAHVAWQSEPALYRRHSAEIPFHEPFSSEELEIPGTGTWELLFQRAVGQYMQLRLTLIGNGRKSPRLRMLRAHYPRFSYLQRYLPTVYQQNAESASFLDRFLANIEGLFTTLEGKIANLQFLMDVDSAPPEFVDWLAGWLGIMFEDDWSVEKRRFFLDHIMQWFHQRGTRIGLERAVRLVIDECIDPDLFDDAKFVGAAGYSVRIVDEFLLRRAPGVVFGDVTQGTIALTVPTEEKWSPAQGIEPLHEDYRDFLRMVYADAIDDLNASWERTGADALANFDAITLPPVQPTQAGEQADWLEFVGTRLTFTYAAITLDDAPHYRAFLRARYRDIATLSTAYFRTYTAFSQIELPTVFPESAVALDDWIQFVSLYIPIQRSAHRFSVLVPIPPESTSDVIQLQLDRVQRVIDIEKPAHTVPTVTPYWMAFRVNEARLGYDTIIQQGSRFVALVIGSGALPDGYLAPAHPFDVPDRFVSDRVPNQPG